MPDDSSSNGTKPRRLKVNEDGSMELPLTKPEGSTTDPEPITLPDFPSADALAKMMDLVAAADDALKEKCGEAPRPVDPANITNDDLRKLKEYRRERRLFAFGPESPHLGAMIEVVKLLTGRELSRAEIPGWCGDPAVAAELVQRYTDPFAGRAGELAMEAVESLGLTSTADLSNETT